MPGVPLMEVWRTLRGPLAVGQWLFVRISRQDVHGAGRRDRAR